MLIVEIKKDRFERVNRLLAEYGYEEVRLSDLIGVAGSPDMFIYRPEGAAGKHTRL
jgi:hypothetical protein